MAIEEHIQIDYDYLIEYLEDGQNAIGTTTSTTLRNITAHNDGNSIYVRKFGKDYLITDVTDIEDPVDVNMIFKVYALDGTLLGSRTGGGAFVDGGTVSPAQGCYLEIEASGGAVTVLATITIDTDVDPGGKIFVCAAESVSDGDTLRLYLSDTTSTYYDSAYKYGGARHTPDSSSSLPYFSPKAAVLDPDTTGYTITTVLDSAIYDEQPVISIAGMILQADEGQTPRITSGVGARVTREIIHDGNNLDTAYVSKTGNDANPGTYQEPYLTIQVTFAGLAGRTYINIKDSETYIEIGIIAIDTVTIESVYGQIPIIKNDGISYLINAGDNTVFSGLILDGENRNSFCIFGHNPIGVKTITVKSCTTKNAVQTGINLRNGTFVVEENLSFNCNEGFEISGDSRVSNLTIKKNVAYDNAVGFSTSGATPGIETTLLMENNLSYNNSIRGFSVNDYEAPDSGIFNNNTAYNNGVVGILATNAATLTFRDCISYSNTTWDIQSSVPHSTISESNFLTNSNFINGGGNISSDPKFCKISTPYKFGLSADSAAYRSGTGNDDMGAHLRIIEYNESNIEVNGFNIDGQLYYNNGLFIVDSANHIGCSTKWCSVFNFQGIGIDPYDDDTDTDFTISNCKIYNNGNGIKLTYGGNTVEENLIYLNTIFGIYANRATQNLNHNVFFNNQYGIYLKTIGNLIKNCITHSNSLFGIYSDASIAITYCCITDGTNNVDTSDSSNFIDDPLFLNEISGSEDFNIKTRFGGFNVDSPCYLASDDTPAKDVGAYDVDRSILEEAWKKYVLYSNPSNMNVDQDSAGQIRFKDALGSGSLWAKAHKIIFPLEWDENVATNEEQKDKIKYFSSIIQKREGRNPRTKFQARLRIRIKPTAHLEDGTNGIFDATNKKMTDTNKLLTEDKFKGYNMALIFTAGADMVIDSVAKTGTKAGAGWTIDEHRGRYLKYNGYTYFIKSNTATVLALSDPYSTLVSATISYSIEKYFEIEEHDNAGIFYLIDNDSELVDGTYNYYIDFALTRVRDSKFGYVQPKFAYDRPEWMSGYSLLLEQI